MSAQKELLNSLRIDRAAEPAPRGPRLLLIVVAALLLGLGAFALGRLQAPSSPEQDAAAGRAGPGALSAANAAPAQEASPSAAGGADPVLSASGYITARRMATVASRITGQLTEVLVEEGMRVAEGDVLARLDDKLVRVDLALAEARVKAAEALLASNAAELAEASRVLKRVENLERTDYSSEAALTEARAAVERLTAARASAQAEIEVARLNVAGAREQLALHEIRAPFAGVVTDKAAQPGEVVSPMSAGGGFTRTGVCTIVDMDSLEIEVDVNEAYIGRVQQDQPVTATLDAYPDWDIPAHVIAIIPTANRDKATVRVRIALETNDTRILPDMGVKVAFLRA